MKSKRFILVASLALSLGGCAAIPGGPVEVYPAQPLVMPGVGYPLQVHGHPAYYGRSAHYRGSGYYGGSGPYGGGVVLPSLGHRPAAAAYVMPRTVVAPPRVTPPPRSGNMNPGRSHHGAGVKAPPGGSWRHPGH